MTLSGGGDADLPGVFGCDVWRIRREEHFISVSLFFAGSEAEVRTETGRPPKGAARLCRETSGYAMMAKSCCDREMFLRSHAFGGGAGEI